MFDNICKIWYFTDIGIEKQRTEQQAVRRKQNARAPKRKVQSARCKMQDAKAEGAKVKTETAEAPKARGEAGRTKSRKQERKKGQKERRKGEKREAMQGNEKGRDEFTFEIAEHICVLGKGREEGYQKELNVVSFRGLPPKWDIREWNGEHTRMTKGITLTAEEMERFLSAMNARKSDDEKRAENGEKKGEGRKKTVTEGENAQK